MCVWPRFRMNLLLSSKRRFFSYLFWRSPLDGTFPPFFISIPCWFYWFIRIFWVVFECLLASSRVWDLIRLVFLRLMKITMGARGWISFGIVPIDLVCFARVLFLNYYFNRVTIVVGRGEPRAWGRLAPPGVEIVDFCGFSTTHFSLHLVFCDSIVSFSFPLIIFIIIDQKWWGLGRSKSPWKLETWKCEFLQNIGFSNAIFLNSLYSHVLDLCFYFHY